MLATFLQLEYRASESAAGCILQRYGGRLIECESQNATETTVRDENEVVIRTGCHSNRCADIVGVRGGDRWKTIAIHRGTQNVGRFWHTAGIIYEDGALGNKEPVCCLRR